MALLAVVALTTLAANGSAKLRGTAAALLAVSIAADLIAAGATTPGQLAILAAAGSAAAGILFIAARDGRYGEDPGRRAWVATGLAAVATPLAWVSFRSLTPEVPDIPLLGGDVGNVIVQVAAFWLLSSGIAILITARGAVRTTLGALVMLTGVQLLVRLAPGPQIELTVAVAWLQVVVALTGAFLIVNERALRE
jgi:hypothetical protein